MGTDAQALSRGRIQEDEIALRRAQSKETAKQHPQTGIER